MIRIFLVIGVDSFAVHFPIDFGRFSLIFRSIFFSVCLWFIYHWRYSFSVHFAIKFGRFSLFFFAHFFFGSPLVYIYLSLIGAIGFRAPIIFGRFSLIFRSFFSHFSAIFRQIFFCLPYIYFLGLFPV
jgi:hypothetical protein